MNDYQYFYVFLFHFLSLEHICVPYGITVYCSNKKSENQVLFIFFVGFCYVENGSVRKFFWNSIVCRTS